MPRLQFGPAIALAAAALAGPMPATGQEQIQPGDLVDLRPGFLPSMVRGWQYRGAGHWDRLRRRCCFVLFQRDRTHMIALARPATGARHQPFPAAIRIVRIIRVTLEPDELATQNCTLGDRPALFVVWSERQRRLRYVFTDGNGFTVEERGQEGSARPCDFGIEEVETIG